MKKITAIIMALLLLLSMVACSKKGENGEEDKSNVISSKKDIVTLDVGNFEYAINSDGDYEIVKYTPKTVEVVDIVLPEKTDDGRDIVGVAAEAFKAQNSIKSVTFPSTYEYVGSYAFYGCDALEKVTMADSLTTLGNYTFAKCGKLSEVTVSKALNSVPSFCFANCSALTALDLSGSVAKIERGAFLNCTELASITVSDKLTALTKDAFAGCSKLAYAEDGNGGKYLGNAEAPYIALVSSANLGITACKVNDATLVMANGCLANCPDLEKVTLGNSLKTFDGEFFENSPVIAYNEYENARYLGTESNPYMVLMSGIDITAESMKLHKDTKMITFAAFENWQKLEYISFEGGENGWNSIQKAANWNHGLNIQPVFPASEAAD